MQDVWDVFQRTLSSGLGPMPTTPNMKRSSGLVSLSQSAPALQISSWKLVVSLRRLHWQWWCSGRRKRLNRSSSTALNWLKRSLCKWSCKGFGTKHETLEERTNYLREMLLDKDAILRYGGCFAIALAYAQPRAWHSRTIPSHCHIWEPFYWIWGRYFAECCHPEVAAHLSLQLKFAPNFSLFLSTGGWRLSSLRCQMCRMTCGEQQWWRPCLSLPAENFGGRFLRGTWENQGMWQLQNSPSPNAEITVFPQTVCPHMSTLRGSYGNRVKARVRSGSLGRGTFAVNSRIKVLLCDLHVHFDCAGSHKMSAAVLLCCFGSDRSHNPVGTLGLSDRSRCGVVRLWRSLA